MSEAGGHGPRVSVVIPTHDRASLLKRTLACVLAQERVDLEVIVVDDGSRDGTGALLERVGDDRLRVHRNEAPTGVSAARNRGIELARGAWIALLDDDDLWAPDKLASQLEAAARLGRGWGFTGVVAVTPTLKMVAGGPPPSAEEAVRWLPWRNTVPGGASNVIVRRDLLGTVGGFDPGLRHMSDWDLWIRLGQRGLPAVVPRPLLAYLLHPNNASTDTATILPELHLLEARYAALRAGRRADRAYVHRWIAWNELRSGRRPGALRAYLRAVLSGDVRSAARLLIAAVHPAIFEWVQRRQEPTGEWHLSAERWLSALAPPDAVEDARQ